MRSIRLAGLLLGAAAPLCAQATPKRDSTVSLPNVTTTATRNATPILATPLAVTKIGQADLRASSGYGLEDALRGVPGVIAQSRYGTSDVRLIIRGYGARGAGDRSNSGTSRGIRVLLDGFPETEPDGRTAFDDIDLATAEAVEVIRSNASSLYGNAAGGVVHLMSVPTVSSGLVEAQPVVGGFGLMRAAVRTAAPLGAGGTMWASFTNSSFDGWRKHSDARRMLLNAGARGPIGDRTELGVFLVAANNLMHIPGPLTWAEYNADPAQANATYVTRDERRYNRQGRLGLSLEHRLRESFAISSTFFINPKYLQRSERGTYRDFTRYHMGGNLMARADRRLASTQNRFTLGLDNAYQDGSIQFYTLNTADPAAPRGALSDNKGEGAHNIGIFLQDQLTVNDKLSLLLGARYDRVAYNYRTFFNPAATLKKQTKDFDRVSPKVGVNYRFGTYQSVYANVGGGIEVPAGNETDQPPTGPLPGALLNPLLDAISSTTYEVGTKALGLPLMDGKVTLGYDVAAYNTEVKNEIIPYNGGRYYQTAARARRNGLELGVTAETRPGIFGSASVTFNNHKYSTYVVDSSVIVATNTGQADLSGNQVMGVPKLLANADLGAELPFYRGLRVKFGIEHSGEYWADDKNTVPVPSYTNFDLGLELRQPIVARNGMELRGFITVKNLTDDVYVGSAFLNPDLNGAGQAMAYEPGAPRSVLISFSLGHRQ